MIVINILPQEYLINLQKENFKKKFKVILLFFTIFSLFLGGITFYLKHNFSKKTLNTLENLLREKRASRELYKSIIDVNTKTRIIGEIAKEKNQTYPFIVEILKITPLGINFYEMEFNPKDFNMVIKGIYNKREDFVKFEKNLKSLEKIKNISSPLQNKIFDENGKFIIEINFKK